jgi:outer membrane lipoprotein carrier protein
MPALRTLLLTGLLLICSTAAANQVERFFTQLQTLEADFVQQVQNREQGMLQESAGHVWIERPGKFRWNYHSPYEQELVADGRNLWTYDRDLEQVTVKPAEEVLTDTPAMLLSGSREVASLFRITDLKGEGQLDWYRLVPETGDSSVQEIQLGFAGEELQVMQIEDSFGNRTRLQFRQVQRNQPLDPALFRFSPPPGTDLIGTPQ